MARYPEFTGKVLVATGGASLIVEALARQFVDNGGRVVLGDLQDEFAEQLVSSLGGSGRFVRTDVTSDGDLDALLASAVKDFGGVDYVVSAHTTFACGQLDTTRGNWRTSLDVNVASAAMLVEKAVPLMQQRGGGAAVLVTSVSGKASQPNRIVYPVTKAALLGLNRNLSQALAPLGIRINSVSPGWTWSRNIERRYGTREHADSFAGEFHSIRRMADPEEIADAICYLCSEGASFITGADLAVDGGYSALGPEALGQPYEKFPAINP
jgi:NAD(P)-dependent dehydrogenase (short-subunit alcohol dehydrogenase family)